MRTVGGGGALTSRIPTAAFSIAYALLISPNAIGAINRTAAYGFLLDGAAKKAGEAWFYTICGTTSFRDAYVSMQQSHSISKFFGYLTRTSKELLIQTLARKTRLRVSQRRS
jgi:hypothetical protein